MERRRKSIRRRMQRVVIWISVTALIVTSLVGIVSMLRIRDQSERALAEQMIRNLSNIVSGKALLAESELDRFADQTVQLAEVLHALYEDPDEYIPREILPTSPENAGVFVMQKTLASGELSEEELRPEAELLANLEDVLYPILAAPDSDIAAIYYGTVTGQILCYDDQSDIKPVGTTYYFYDSAWYRLGEETRQVGFTNVYLDNFGRGLTITCAAPFYDAEDAFAGVIGMDILITDVYEETVSLDLGEGAYAFLVDGEGNIISPDGGDRTIADEMGLNESLIAQLLGGEETILLTQSGVYYAAAPVANVGWTLCIHIPQKLVLGAVRQMDENIRSSILAFLGIFLVILGMVFWISWRFANNLTEPLLELGSDVERISGGNLEYRARIHDNDEIGDLAVKFNDMAKSLRIYIENLTSVTAEQERMEAELGVATRIQMDMLPSEFPDHPEFDLYATMTPAREVGGDFYDFRFTDEEHLVLVLADVAGKGVPAALFMTVAKTLLQNRIPQGGSPAEILADVNDQLCESNESDMFVTVWLGILSLKDGMLICANAGHEYPAIRRAGGEYEFVTAENDPPLGAMPGLVFTERRTQIAPGDSLFLYTDGVPEAKNASGERYGAERMLSALRTYGDSPAKDMLGLLKADIDAFVNTDDPFDDITMLVFKRKIQEG